ncbi:SWIM zinc finger family protein [Tsukamurella sp. 1534]|uniref:SWIM zinc finger family protein n=1 Tax=Tsukamurella sp. 1534 TaxID=1151061 RepID=UPI0002F388A3|nr:SWIM zinc finger family protein [Tsukamurella sp. 1534]
MTTPRFGFTAWGFDLVRIAEPVTASRPNTAAPRARMIARNGGVALETDGRQVTARVHSGSLASLAHLEFAAMAPATATALRATLGNRHEPDDATHAALVAAGLRPAPVLEAADCSCRARSTACVHVLAALYALAALVDHEPVTALAIQSAGGSGAPADEAGRARPVPRWTPLAALHARDYYAPAGP